MITIKYTGTLQKFFELQQRGVFPEIAVRSNGEVGEYSAYFDAAKEGQIREWFKENGFKEA
jgi:hypothetical protein